MSWYTRIKGEINRVKTDPRFNKGRVEPIVHIKITDIEELLYRYDVMDNELREQRIDAELRSEPTIINMPESIEKELYIKANKDTLF